MQATGLEKISAKYKYPEYVVNSYHSVRRWTTQVKMVKRFIDIYF